MEGEHLLYGGRAACPWVRICLTERDSSAPRHNRLVAVVAAIASFCRHGELVVDNLYRLCQWLNILQQIVQRKEVFACFIAIPSLEV